jgi:uncharacterized protein (DUF2252 family)
VLIALLAACGETSLPSDARQAWLVNEIVTDNLRWLTRDPSLLEAKYGKMSADPYDFFRGAAGVYARDQVRAGGERSPTAFLTSPGAFGVLLAGDPHPENVGTMMPEDGPGPESEVPPMLLELVDLDGAGYGPYLFDVRRAEGGLAWMAELVGCSGGCRDAVVAAHAGAYAAEILATAAGNSLFAPGLVAERADPVTAALLEDVIVEGQDREVMDRATTIPTEGERRFTLGEGLDEAGEGVLACSPEERAQVERLLATYTAPTGFRVLDQARSFGVGVASLPAVRYLVAWDRGDPGPGDDELLMLREVVDPAGLPALYPQPAGRFRSNADRVVSASHALWSRPDADPRADGLLDGAMSFKVLTWSAWNQTYSHKKVARDYASGVLGEAEIATWAALLGSQLAAAHARAPLADGGDAVAAISADLEGRTDPFVAERVAESARDVAVFRSDYALFVDAIESLGPLLGSDGLGAP